MSDSPATRRAPQPSSRAARPSAPSAPADGRRVWLSAIGLACSLPPLWAAWQRWTVARPMRIGAGQIAVGASTEDGIGGASADAAVVTTQRVPQAAWAPLLLSAALDLGPSRRIPLPPTFNRALLLCQDWTEGPGGWVGAAVDPHESRSGYGLSYIWWTGIQRFAMIEVPAPGYVRRLHDGMRDDGTAVVEFLKRRLGFRRDRLKADDPAPFAFNEAEYQSIPARLRLRVARASLAGLTVGDTVSLVPGELNSQRGDADPDPDARTPARPDVGLRARVTELTALAADPGTAESGEMAVEIALDETARQRLARLALEQELQSPRPRAPQRATLSLARTGTADPAAPGFVWLPRAAVLADPGSTERGAALGRVWIVVGELAVPIRVLIGSRNETHLAVQEALPPGLPLAVDPEVWTRWPHDLRARLLRDVASPAEADGPTGSRVEPIPHARPLSLLRPGRSIIVAPDPDLRAGQAVRPRTQESA